MTMKFSKTKRLLSLVMGIAVLLSCVMFYSICSFASQGISLSATSVANNSFDFVIKFPAVDWRGGFQFTITYDSNVLQYSRTSCSYLTPTVNSSAAGTIKISGSPDQEVDPSSSNTTITISFTVKDASALNTQISATVVSFLDYNGGSICGSPSPLNVTLRQGSTTTDTSGSSSGSQSSDSQSSGSQSSGSTGTTNTGTTSNTGTTNTGTTNTGTTSNTSSAKPSSNPVSSTPVTSDTGTETDTQITDTESGFEISQTETDAGTGTEGAPPVTDTNDAPSGTTTGISASADTSTQKPKGGLDLSTSAIAIISLSVAAFICCLLTLAGFLRHKKD